MCSWLSWLYGCDNLIQIKQAFLWWKTPLCFCVFYTSAVARAFGKRFIFWINFNSHSSTSKAQRGIFSAFLEADAHGFSPAVGTPCAAGSKEDNRFVGWRPALHRWSRVSRRYSHRASGNHKVREIPRQWDRRNYLTLCLISCEIPLTPDSLLKAVPLFLCHCSDALFTSRNKHNTASDAC